MFNYIILGMIQGITEFLPVSSSGHLVIMQRILGITQNQVAISVILHLGTAFALVVFFFKDILKLFTEPKSLKLLFITTLITVIIGLWGKDFFESFFVSAVPVAIALIVNGFILIPTKQFMKNKKDGLDYKDAAVLGLTQAIAIIPGISRSGITISTLLFRGIDRENSFRFSFLAAIPVIFGAAIFEAKNIDLAIKAEVGHLLVGFITSFLVGIISLKILKIILDKAKLYYFGYYCIIIGIVTLLSTR
jgi:undecaprenyl-diphosphatase